MANYYASCRSNYFRVKDATAFRSAMAQVDGIRIHENERGFCILGNDGDGAGWPSYRNDPNDDDETVEFDLFGVVAEHLLDNEVAIFMEIGAEKLRYLVGNAVAVNNKGRRREVSLEDIYEKAEALVGMTNPDAPREIIVTRVEY